MAKLIETLSSGILPLQTQNGNLPLIQFAVNEILGLVSRGACREHQEVCDISERQILQKLVCNCDGLPCASGTDAENLEAQSAMQHNHRHTVCASQCPDTCWRKCRLLLT